MKLWEVIKALTEDQTKLFRKDSEFYVGFTTEGALGWKDENGAFKSYFTVREDNLLDDGWKPVKQPVTWQEAIQAWADGKKVSYKYPDDKTMYPFEDTNQMLSIEKIKVAAWYVED